MRKKSGQVCKMAVGKKKKKRKERKPLHKRNCYITTTCNSSTVEKFF